MLSHELVGVTLPVLRLAASLPGCSLASQVLEEPGRYPALPFTHITQHVSNTKSGYQHGWLLQTNAPSSLPPPLQSKDQFLTALLLISLFSLQREELQRGSQHHAALYPVPSDGLQWMLRKTVKEGIASEILPL